MTKFQLIEYFSALISAVSEDAIENGRISFSRAAEMGDYKVSLHLGKSRDDKIRAITEDGVFARVQEKMLIDCPHKKESEEEIAWTNGWKLEHYRRLKAC